MSRSDEHISLADSITPINVLKIANESGTESSSRHLFRVCFGDGPTDETAVIKEVINAGGGFCTIDFILLHIAALFYTKEAACDLLFAATAKGNGVLLTFVL
ncbi:Hypothetical predicted protein [Mytilus galloprovincialis]|uniref:Uncharacterized protein n=1 Tax=Mytilus galloprovincialis TaxID=29158 RepID=A0A8B6GGW6_MYTGA|nr:Hypothetical predicted protein [Mytilus galloprovincialis]